MPSDSDWSSDIAKALSRRLVGQPAAIAAVVPYVEMYRARLTPEGRPAGIFLLLGPTGTGKTKTVEALAEVLHGSPKKLLKVDCGEYQMEHEVAKLLGAPPGYLGHRETQPLLTQQKLSGAASESCDLSILLFDEIEKAAPSLVRLLLGVLDKATLRLGDSTLVNFEKTMIFLTSNLGAREMSRELCPEFGFESVVPRASVEGADKLERIGKTRGAQEFFAGIHQPNRFGGDLSAARFGGADRDIWISISKSCRTMSIGGWANRRSVSKCRRDRASSCSRRAPVGNMARGS